MRMPASGGANTRLRHLLSPRRLFPESRLIVLLTTERHFQFHRIRMVETVETEAERILAFKNTLKDLVSNSKPHIIMLTELALAEEHIESAAAGIARVIEERIREVRNMKSADRPARPEETEMTLLYLMDSIVKNSKDPNQRYLYLFTQNIVSNFCDFFDKCKDEKIRDRLFKLRTTWTGLFPADKLSALDRRVKLELDPAWPFPPFRTLPPAAAATPGTSSKLPAGGQRLRQETLKKIEEEKEKIESEQRNIIEQQNRRIPRRRKQKQMDFGDQLPEQLGAKRKQQMELAAVKRQRGKGQAGLIIHNPPQIVRQAPLYSRRPIPAMSRMDPLLYHARERMMPFEDHMYNNQQPFRPQPAIPHIIPAADSGMLSRPTAFAAQPVPAMQVQPQMQVQLQMQQQQSQPQMQQPHVSTTISTLLSQLRDSTTANNKDGLWSKVPDAPPATHSTQPPAVPTASPANKHMFANEPALEWTSESLRKSRKSVVAKLYNGEQCSSCPQRFFSQDKSFYKRHPDEHEKDRKTYANHVQWHFRQNNKKRSAGGSAGQSRAWYYRLPDWLLFKEVNDEIEIGEESSFDKEKLDEVEDEVEEKTVTARTDKSQNVCTVCREVFEPQFREEDEEWILPNAVQHDDLIYHPACLQDFLKNGAGNVSFDREPLDEAEDEVEAEVNDEANDEVEDEVEHEAEHDLEHEVEEKTLTASTDKSQDVDIVNREEAEPQIPEAEVPEKNEVKRERERGNVVVRGKEESAACLIS